MHLAHNMYVYSPNPSLCLLFLLVKFFDVGELSSVIVAPQHRVAVIAGTHNAVLSEPLTGEVGEVAVINSHSPTNSESAWKVTGMNPTN